MFSIHNGIRRAVGAMAFLWFASSLATVIKAGDITITYKETKICETTSGVKSFSGYATIPASMNPVFAPYDSQMFFWFFESRNDPAKAPFTLWLQGGPGAGSIDQAVGGHNGPCIVQGDSNSTILNPWSWNNNANVLYLDQPVQAGYSYDVATPGVLDMTTAAITPGQANSSTYLKRSGVFGSQNMAQTANTTAIAVKVVQGLVESVFTKFSTYKRDSINIWSQSYGGHWAPALASGIMEQRKQCGKSGCSLTVDSVGIINGFIDGIVQGPYWPQFAVNNTYGIQAYNLSTARTATDNFYKPGGCQDIATVCQRAAAQSDPNNYGGNQTVNNICLQAFGVCWGTVYGYYEDPRYSQPLRSPFDIANTLPTSFPPPYSIGFLNNKWVQDALGAKVNYTQDSGNIANIYVATGDFIRGGFSQNLASLLDQGVKVALIYGDRDYRANWLGGEAVSLAMPYSQKGTFATAGYANIVTNANYIGGVVRQHGLFSFSRVFEAGHEVPYYQPETAYRIFLRTIQATDVATGLVPLARNPGYSSSGPASSFGIKNVVPPPAPIQCYIDFPALGQRCTQAQLAALSDGTAVVVNRIVVSPAA